jgi:putative hydrolase of the HAD superfamily
LKGRGLRLGILSDYPVEQKLKGMGLDDLGWDALLCAEDAEALKPQPAPFGLALDRLGLDPDRVLYVGDRPDTDVDGAGALGMRTCLIRRFGRRSPRADLVVDRLALLPSLLG